MSGFVISGSMRDALLHTYKMREAFNYESFCEATKEGGKSTIMRETASDDGSLRIITYYRKNRSSDNTVPNVFITRMFIEGVVPEDSSSYVQHHNRLPAMREHDALVAQFLAVYNAAPCLLEGAL